MTYAQNEALLLLLEGSLQKGNTKYKKEDKKTTENDQKNRRNKLN